MREQREQAAEQDQDVHGGAPRSVERGGRVGIADAIHGLAERQTLDDEQEQ